ncbi:MAG: ABC transporter permease [Candidatus Thiodiazotropha sp. (ex Epidulcina cf. delphinae)]|nr:ABC transporter permease [Candidatus Thiodiazotropha sp. (ex Epidulcina cf. delphinae)]
MSRPLSFRLFSDSAMQALYALRDNRLRTMLSVLGIAIGVAAVMAVGAVSKGGNHLIFSELQTFGLNSIWVFRDRNDKDPHRLVREGSGITNEDYSAVQAGCCSALKYVSAVVKAKKRYLIQNHNRYSNAEIKGIDVMFTKISNDFILEGRGFRKADIVSRRAVALLGSIVVEDLFGKGSSPVGREFRIAGRKFIVVGLLKEKSRDFLESIGSAGGQDANNRILIPYTLQQQIVGNKEINYLIGEALSLEAAKTATTQIIDMLNWRSGGNFRYKSETMAKYIETTDNILNGVSIIGVVAASISLLVGGMGIMNIMSTSVLERTREIGLRKAVGARSRDVLMQFLLESVAISTIGGVIGLMLGALASIILAVITGFPLTPSPMLILLALLVTILVGIVSGFVPARRAARLAPVEALRYE